MLQRARFMRWLTRTLLADDAGTAAVDLEARVAHAVLAEKPEFAPENLRFRRRLVAEIARPCRRRRRRRAARYFSYQSVATVGNLAEMA